MCCNYPLAGVSELAIYFNPSLHRNSLNLAFRYGQQHHWPHAAARNASSATAVGVGSGVLSSSMYAASANTNTTTATRATLVGAAQSTFRTSDEDSSEATTERSVPVAIPTVRGSGVRAHRLVSIVERGEKVSHGLHVTQRNTTQHKQDTDHRPHHRPHHTAHHAIHVGLPLEGEQAPNGWTMVGLAGVSWAADDGYCATTESRGDCAVGDKGTLRMSWSAHVSWSAAGIG